MRPTQRQISMRMTRSMNVARPLTRVMGLGLVGREPCEESFACSACGDVPSNSRRFAKEEVGDGRRRAENAGDGSRFIRVDDDETHAAAPTSALSTPASTMLGGCRDGFGGNPTARCGF